MSPWQRVTLVVVPIMVVGFGAAAFDGHRSHDDPAQAEATSMLDSFRHVIGGATDGVKELDAAPDKTLGFGLGVTGVENEDYRLTSWWRVPEAVSDVVAYLRAHRVDGASAEQDVSGVSNGVASTVVTYGWPGTNVYAAPTLFVTLEQDGDSTDLAARTSIAPRPPRSVTTYIDSHVSSIELTLRRNNRVSTREVDDTDQTAGVVAAFNALQASPTTKMSYVTGGVGIDPRMTLVTNLLFRTETGDVPARLETDGADLTVVLAPPGPGDGPSLDGGMLRGGFMTKVEKIVSISVGKSAP